MTMETRGPRNHSFVYGLLTGACVGVGLAAWLAPKASADARRRVSDSMRELGDRAAEGVQQAGSRVARVVEDATRSGQQVRDGLADAVASGAREIERLAVASKTASGERTP